MTLYLAAPFACKIEARLARQQLFAAGFHVRASWLDADSDYDDSPRDLEWEAERDLAEIDEADAVVVLQLGVSEGKSFETGYAYAIGKVIILVGFNAHNVFHYLSGIEKVSTLTEAIATLRGGAHVL